MRISHPIIREPTPPSWRGAAYTRFGEQEQQALGALGKYRVTAGSKAARPDQCRDQGINQEAPAPARRPW